MVLIISNSLSFKTTQSQHEPFRIIFVALVRAQGLLSDAELIGYLSLCILPCGQPYCELVISHYLSPDKLTLYFLS